MPVKMAGDNLSTIQKMSFLKNNYIDRLLLEKIPLAGITRSTAVFKRWLQYYAN